MNKLIDSSKAEGGDAGSIGIHQQLEKKQGLFRRHDGQTRQLRAALRHHARSPSELRDWRPARNTPPSSPSPSMLPRTTSSSCASLWRTDRRCTRAWRHRGRRGRVIHPDRFVEPPSQNAPRHARHRHRRGVRGSGGDPRRGSGEGAEGAKAAAATAAAAGSARPLAKKVPSSSTATCCWSIASRRCTSPASWRTPRACSRASARSACTTRTVPRTMPISTATR